MIVLFIFFCCIFGPIVGQKKKDSDLNYPDCGKRSKPDSNLELGAYTSEPGNFPWHVAIYKYDKFEKTHENICGGSIIAPHIVLTAAKCVYDAGSKSTYAPTFFKVVAGKISFELSTPDPNGQEVNVNEIAVPETYLGDTTSYAENIAALNLASDLVFNDLVSPVCWTRYNKRENAPRAILQTAGWGLIGSERYSTTLKEAYLEYINIVLCRKKYTSIRYLRFINYDKICVLTPKGRKDYDTGGGLVQKKGDRYYLVAILSTNIDNDFSPSTNITKHYDWLTRTVSGFFSSHKRCNEGGFLCRDGTACIGEEYVCDGKRHCPDGSDEIKDACPTPVTRDFSNSRGSCKLPNQRGGVSYTRLNCPSDCEMKAGMFVRSGERIRIHCGLGFGPSSDRTDSKFICSDGTWFDREPECIRLCPALKNKHVNFECSLGGVQVDCGNFMRPGTVAKFRCDKFYRFNLDPLSFVDSTTCRLGGTWSEKVPTCTSECGIVNQVNRATPTLYWANKTTYGEYPWHAGIFLKVGNKFDNICGGSLISENFILTAAHCVFDQSTNERFKEENVKVAVGKAKRDLYVQEPFQVTSSVMNIITPETYAGPETRYEQDIALIKTVISFKFNDFVLRVCIDRFGAVTFNHNTLGLVVGWGLTEENTYSTDLREARLPIMPIIQCRKTFQDFVQFITSDKFCVIHQNGTGTQMGDSGGGMTFDVGGHHYIHGVVSVKKKDSNLFSVFTNVTDHLDWILTTMRTHSSPVGSRS